MWIYHRRKLFSDILFRLSIFIVTFANVNIFYVYKSNEPSIYISRLTPKTERV